MAKTITIEWIRSGIGRMRWQKETVRALGLRRLHDRRTLPDNPSVRGMISAVNHLIRIVPQEEKVKKEAS